MSPKSDKSEESIPKSKRPKKTASKDRITTSDQNANNEENSSKPTRNCGCNTLISGNIEDKSQAAQPKKDDANCCASSSNSGCNSCCCCWPRYSYYYNPYTCCYCWYKNRCCCGGNTCCNSSCNHCCSNSCPTPAQSSNANLEPDASKSNKQPKSETTSKSASENEKRIAGGATNSFVPEIQVLYDKWMEFNEHAFNASQFPTTATNSVPFYNHPSQFPFYTVQQQQDGRNYGTTSPMQNKPQQKQATDFNWVPL
ncbi:GH17065 [Drosophila grimshawi]|uniref:GH17065 n=2 Tax=Drosophila grimshawi TaxID=7222 RepID=B4IZL9_DROGR|nr:GH17065 [Drosophila grimshawi]